MSDERVWTNSTAVRQSLTAAAWDPDGTRAPCPQCGQPVLAYGSGLETHNLPRDERGRTARCSGRSR